MSLSNKVVFILGIAKFDGPYESTSFTVAKFLAKNNKVFYVDYPYTWKDYYKRRDEAFFKRKKQFSKNSDGIIPTDLDNLKIVIVPPLLSINFLKEGWLYRFMLKINERTIMKRINRVIEKYNIPEFVFINSFNFHYPDIGKMLKPKLYVYHCVDPLIVDHDTKHGIISEQMIVKACDMVVCTSKQLFNDKIKFNSCTFFIPNAADITHSSKAMLQELMINKVLTGIPKPVIGYFGNIERRIDFEFLEVVCKLNPNLNFVFAGPVESHYVPQSFNKLSNVYFVGRVPYDEMPSVLKGFDVAMIPFKKDEVSNTIFPLKLFEYLGTGKPVVATDFNMDLKDFTEDTIKYCASAQEFSDEIRFALNHDTELKQIKRRSIATQNSWDRRLEELSNLINEFYLVADKKASLNRPNVQSFKNNIS
jgi:teichuronic acid biosynthesis glycosyltransferase TuaH